MKFKFGYNLIAIANAFTLARGESGFSKQNSNSFFEYPLMLLAGVFEDLFKLLATVLIRLFTLIGRFMLTAIDFCVIFVRQFLGIQAESTTLEDLAGDKIFAFVFSDTVLKAIKYMIIIGLVLIILFSIIAILKAEYGNISGTPTDKKHVLVSALKSVFLMVIIPVIFIASIILSNAVLAGLYSATSGGEDVSVGTSIWRASTYQANAYRAYANEDLRVPVFYTFSGEISLSDGSTINTDGGVSELEDSYLEFKAENQLTKYLSTAYMFLTHTFDSLSAVDATERTINGADPTKHSAYYDVYDQNFYVKGVEYYACADAIDFMVQTNHKTAGGFFIKSINDVYEEWARAAGAAEITALPITKTTRLINGEDVSGYQVKVSYVGETGETVYFSPENTYDEANGTVYTMCYSQLNEITAADGSKVETSLPVPLIQGENGFYSDYIAETGGLVIARGMFNQEGYPTAIRSTAAGDIEFYRHNINLPTIIDLFPTISYELPEGKKELSLLRKFAKSAVDIITGLDADELIPYVYINFDIFAIGKKLNVVEGKITDSNFRLNYNMTDNSLKTYNLYREVKINSLILIFASVLVLKSIFFIAFGLIARIFDMVALAITYPYVVASIPLDGGGGLKNWSETFMHRLFFVYGIVVAFNIVLLMMPMIWNISFWSSGELTPVFGASTGELGEWTATFLNLLTHVLFTVVGFSMIEGLARRFNFMLSTFDMKGLGKLKKKKKVKGDIWQILDEGKETGFIAAVGGDGVREAGVKQANQAMDVIKTAGGVVSGRALKKLATTNMGRLNDYIPGRGVKTITDDIRMHSRVNSDIRQRARNQSAYSRELTAGIDNEPTLTARRDAFKGTLGK